MKLFRIALCTLAALTAFAAFAGHHLGYRWNKTKSLPSGIYRYVPTSPELIKSGDLVVACPEQNERQKEARRRGYLPYGLGCAGGFAPLFKIAMALPDDRVEITQGEIKINGEIIKNSSRLNTDSQNRDLPPMPDSGVVPEGKVWLLSDYAKRSWDSRYFGPVPLNTIQGLAYPVWTFD